MWKENTRVENRPDRHPWTAGGMTRLAYARAKAAGVTLDPILRRVGLTRHQLENPRNHVRVRDQIKFLNLAAVALEDDLLGFHLGQTTDLRDLGLLYYVFASSELLIDALQRAERYSSIVNEGILLKCMDGRAIRLTFHSVGTSRHLDRHQIECSMAVLVRMCRQLTGLRLLPNRVRLMHHRARNAEFTKFFGVHVECGAPTDDITFSKTVRRAPAVGADPYLNKLLISYCEEAVSSRPQTRGSFRSSVENAVVPVLPHGKARAAEIARQLGVGERTLPVDLRRKGSHSPSFWTISDPTSLAAI